MIITISRVASPAPYYADFSAMAYTYYHRRKKPAMSNTDAVTSTRLLCTHYIARENNHRLTRTRRHEK
nr:MAG TPA: hypothetical protein [Caudoviricetes sp.]